MSTYLQRRAHRRRMERRYILKTALGEIVAGCCLLLTMLALAPIGAWLLASLM